MRGFSFGAMLGSLPGLAFGGWAVMHNPWFLDRPVLFLTVAVLLPALALGGLGALLRRGRVGREVLLWLLPIHLLLLVLLRPEPPPDPVDVLVMGIDGATFDIIDPLIEGGELPALASLQSDGTRAVLRSMEPMFSPLLWTTIASGKPPSEHGIHGFHVRASDAQVPRLWDIADAEGRSVGIYKWLVTYPPRPVDGFIVPSWLAPGPETWPEELSFVKELELSNRLRRRKVAARRGAVELALAGVPQGLRFGTLWEGLVWKVRERLEKPKDDERFYTLQLLRGRIDRDVFVHALHQHQPDLATFTYYATDGLAHRFWTYHQPEAFDEVDPAKLERYGDALTDAYRQSDAILGEVLERVGPDTTVLVISDHGFRAFDPEEDPPSFQPLTERLRERLAEEGLETDLSRMGIKISVALTDPGQTVAELEAVLETLTDAEGEPFFVWEPVPEAPNTLGLTLADESVDAARIRTDTVGGEPMRRYVKLVESFSGEHDSAGVFYARGEGIPAGERAEELSLLDIAPTVQALLGVPPAQDLEGRVVFGPRERGPASRDDLVESLRFEEGEGGVDEDALRALGYIE